MTMLQLIKELQRGRQPSGRPRLYFETVKKFTSMEKVLTVRKAKSDFRSIQLTITFSVWSLGITLFAFLYGDVPFKSPTIPVLYEQIKSEEPIFPVKPVISEGVKDLISKMLNKDPEQRANMQLIKVRPLIR